MSIEQAQCDCYMGWTTPQRKIVCPKCNGTGLIEVEVLDIPNPSLTSNGSEQSEQENSSEGIEGVIPIATEGTTTEGTAMSFLKGD